jgi:hypothetical protein
MYIHEYIRETDTDRRNSVKSIQKILQIYEYIRQIYVTFVFVNQGACNLLQFLLAKIWQRFLETSLDISNKSFLRVHLNGQDVWVS